MNAGRVEVSARSIATFAAVGVLGLGLTFLRVLTDPRLGLLSYLIAFAYWLSLALGALLWLAIFHASKARWPVVFRRLLEVISVATVMLAFLFIPIVAGAGQLFSWVNPQGEMRGELLKLLAHKRVYLNLPFFIGRAVLYFSVWIGVSSLLHYWSVRQDSGDEIKMLSRQQKLGAGILPVLAICLTFAAFDWLMSLDATWYSTIFGVYYFSGGFLGAIALVTLISALPSTQSQLGSFISVEHFHNLGKLLLAFVSFWAYIGFSQLLLIWIANLPEEISWYMVRIRGSWRPVAFLLAIGHFVVPFLVLLSRDVKRKPKSLAAIAAWILFIHYVDLQWVIAPTLRRAPSLEWSDLTAFLGVGGMCIAFALWLFRGRYAIPVRDPYLAQSLEYVQP